MPSKYHLDEQKIIDMYVNKKLTCVSISKIFKVCRKTITDILVKNNINIRKRKISLEEYNNIKNYYLSGLSSIQVAQIYNTKHSTILEILKKMSIKRRSTIHRKYFINKYYFDKINSHDKAYFLGLLFADGCLCYSKRRGVQNDYIRLALQDMDKHILESFKFYLNYNRPLGLRKFKNNNFKNCKNQFILCINSKYLVNSLKKLGFTRNKSKKIYWPKGLSKKYYSSFILGFFDGDGSISIDNEQLHFSICGLENIIKKIQQILIANCDIRKTKLHYIKSVKIKKFTVVAYHGNRNCLKIYRWLYSNAPVFLYRKKQKFEEILYKYKHTPLYSLATNQLKS
jgi:hypothetical protein